MIVSEFVDVNLQSTLTHDQRDILDIFEKKMESKTNNKKVTENKNKIPTLEIKIENLREEFRDKINELETSVKQKLKISY